MITWLEEGKKLYNTSQNKVERDKSGDNSKFQLILLQQAVLKLYEYKVSHDKYEQALKLYKNATTIGYVGRTYSKSAVIEANETINLESEKAQVETCLSSEKKKDSDKVSLNVSSQDDAKADLRALERKLGFKNGELLEIIGSDDNGFKNFIGEEKYRNLITNLVLIQQ
ncbi:unnamed protein product [Ambrosiozyma monospora]|uniref:Unnamed protein product n=1 Tax=Ambrosiozyma monospora TaxID=43982 RepID=A0ACB5SSY2_AMBMO|nr:unnamed protein product [Ambrosiozyma monospora]